MKSKSVIEGIITFLFLGVLLLFLNPLGIWMPSAVVMTLLCILVILFLLFGSFLWNEKTQDERENFHKMLAGRIGYLMGSGILVTGIIFQEYTHTFDPWLVYALSGMILGKIFALWYSRKNH